MFDAVDLVNAMKQASTKAIEASQPSDFCFGKVISTSPLKITVEQKMTLGATQLVLTRNVTDFETELSFDDSGIKQDYENWTTDESELIDSGKIAFTAKIKHKITIYNALKTGEDVVLMKQKGGQKYLVIDRVVKA